MKKSLHIIICLLLFCVQFTRAYAKDPYNYIHYKLDDGLPSETVYAIEQDTDGYIWVATEAGLSRFNGNEFVNFTTKDGLFKNEVVDLSNDNNGKIWLNLSGPYSYVENNTFTSFDHKIYNDINWNLRALHNGKDITWITSRNNLFYVKNNDLSLTENPWIKNFEIKFTQIIGKYNSEFYILINDNIYVVNDTTLIEKIPFKFAEGKNGLTKLIYAFDYPNLFFFQNNSLINFNFLDKEQKVIDSDFKKVRKLKKVGQNLIIADIENGLTSIELDEEQNVINKSKKLKDKYISSFNIDMDLNLWLSSVNDGLFLYPDFFKKKTIDSTYQQFENSNCELLKVYNDTIWIGTREGNIIRQTKNGAKIFKVPTENKNQIYQLKDLIQLKKDVMLLSTDFGLYTLNKDQFNLIHFTAGKKLFIKENSILINTYDNLYSCEKNKILNSKNELLTADDFKNIQKGRVYTSIKDRYNNIWAAHSLKGLIKINDESEIQLRAKSPIFNANIVDMIIDDSGFIYAATIGDGIIIIDSETNDFTVINTDYGLSSNVIYALSQYENKLYAGTNRGLSIISSPINFFNKKNTSIEVYNTKNGLLSNEIKDLEVNQTGIHLAGPSGYLNFNVKDAIKITSNKIIIETIKVNDEDAAANRLIGMPHSKNNLKFKYNGLQFGNSLNFNYAYRLKNYDENWVITKSTEANYQNLQAGSYTFEVGILQNGETDIASINKSIVDISIEPHYTNSLWFKLLLALLAALIFVSIISGLISRRQQKVLKQLVTEKTFQLNNKVKELAYLNDELGRSNRDLNDFAHVCSHDLKSPLRNISSFSELLYKRFQDEFNNNEIEYYNFVKGGVNKMEQVINDLMAHSKISSDKTMTAVDFNTIVSDIENELNLSFKKRNGKLKIITSFPTLNYNSTQAYQLLKNLIYNGLKYNKSISPIISVGCVENENDFEFYVKDNGIGIEEEYFAKIFNMFNRLHSDMEYEGTGIGLAICQRITEKFNGRIWVESKKGEGSTFYFTIPKDLKINQPLLKVV